MTVRDRQTVVTEHGAPDGGATRHGPADGGAPDEGVRDSDGWDSDGSASDAQDQSGAGAREDDTLAWFDHLAAAGNTRELWAERKGAYAADVRAPFLAYLEALDAVPGMVQHGPWRVYRPHNDLRFTPDGDPLKTFVGAVAERPGGGGLYTQVDAAGLMVAAGMPWFAPDQLVAWRAALTDETTGEELTRVVAEVRRLGLQVGHGRPEPLRRPPRGVPVDHPRERWLRWKGVEALVRLGRPAWSDPATRAGVAADSIAAAWPLLSWLERHVGPSALPRPRR